MESLFRGKNWEAVDFKEKNIMIISVEEFVRLQRSNITSEFQRTITEEIPLPILREIIENEPELRTSVARNKKVPLEILRILADDEDADVRMAVADKRSLDEDLFEKLAKDSDDGVRGRIAYNKKTPLKLLQELALDQVDFIAEAASKRCC